MAHFSEGTLGILFPQGARKLVRQDPTNLSDRLQRYITKKLYPEALTVRGNWVAIDYVAEALIRHGTMSRCELFVEPGYTESAKAILGLNGNHDVRINSSGRQIHVASTLELTTRGDKLSFTAFLNPAGGSP